MTFDITDVSLMSLAAVSSILDDEAALSASVVSAIRDPSTVPPAADKITPNVSTNRTSTTKTAVTNIAMQLSATHLPWRKIRKAIIRTIKVVLTLAGSVMAYLALSTAMWSSAKDYREDCRGQNTKYGHISESCAKVLDYALARPLGLSMFISKSSGDQRPSHLTNDTSNIKAHDRAAQPPFSWFWSLIILILCMVSFAIGYFVSSRLRSQTVFADIESVRSSDPEIVCPQASTKPLFALRPVRDQSRRVRASSLAASDEGPEAAIDSDEDDYDGLVMGSGLRKGCIIAQLSPHDSFSNDSKDAFALPSTTLKGKNETPQPPEGPRGFWRNGGKLSPSPSLESSRPTNPREVKERKPYVRVASLTALDAPGKL